MKKSVVMFFSVMMAVSFYSVAFAADDATPSNAKATKQVVLSGEAPAPPSAPAPAPESSPAPTPAPTLESSPAPSSSPTPAPTPAPESK